MNNMQRILAELGRKRREQDRHNFFILPIALGATVILSEVLKGHMPWGPRLAVCALFLGCVWLFNKAGQNSE